jgi:hypothetical protein
MMAACGPHVGTDISSLEARTAIVGVELEVPIQTSAQGAVDFSFTSDVADLATRRLRASITPYAGGIGMFRWQPMAADLGKHSVHITAKADGGSADADVAIEVVAGADPIVFREPIGDGTTLDTKQAPCANVDILTDSSTSTEVTLTVDPPVDNAIVMQEGSMSGTLKFCPSQDQINSSSVFAITLVATDDVGKKAQKTYAIILGKVTSTGTGSCPEPPPTITIVPHKDITTSGNLHINASVSDSTGIASFMLYYSTTAPLDPANPDLSTMQQIPMAFLDGTSDLSGDYTAAIPNPVKFGNPGDTATIYYVLTATDHDFEVKGCSAQTANSPATGVYSFVVTRDSR